MGDHGADAAEFLARDDEGPSALRVGPDRLAVGDPDRQHQELRSQMLSLLYQAVHRGEMTKEDAERRLFYARGMRIRLHEDHVLQDAAWNVADRLGWSDTFDAEYVALTQLEADALITLDRQLADALKDLVAVAPIEGAVLIEAILANDHATRWHSSA